MLNKKGFTLIELAVVIAILGILAVPLLSTLQQSRLASTASANRTALEQARDALLAYAAQHKGCLPHAADFEGGVPDTDIAGNSGYTDTGSVRTAVEPAGGNTGQRAGDIPWADIGLGNTGRDANTYRIQYYVGSAYTSPTQTRAANDNPATRDDCAARIRTGAEAWDGTARYTQGDVVIQNGLYYVAAGNTTATPPAAPWALFGNAGTLPAWNSTAAYNTNDYATDSGNAYRAIAPSTNAQPFLSPSLWQQVGIAGQPAPYPAWQTGTYFRGEIIERNGRTYRVTALSTSAAPPATGWQEISTAATTMLQTRVGPDITTAPGSATASSNNVFVLIAAGKDATNLALGSRPAMRDALHQTCTTTTCTAWSSLNDVTVDTRTFSITPNDAPSPDTVLAVSFADYQAALAKRNLNATGLAW